MAPLSYLFVVSLLGSNVKPKDVTFEIDTVSNLTMKLVEAANNREEFSILDVIEKNYIKKGNQAKYYSNSLRDFILNGNVSSEEEGFIVTIELNKDLIKKVNKKIDTSKDKEYLAVFVPRSEEATHMTSENLRNMAERNLLRTRKNNEKVDENFKESSNKNTTDTVIQSVDKDITDDESFEELNLSSSLEFKKNDNIDFKSEPTNKYTFKKPIKPNSENDEETLSIDKNETDEIVGSDEVKDSETINEIVVSDRPIKEIRRWKPVNGSKFSSKNDSSYEGDSSDEPGNIDAGKTLKLSHNKDSVKNKFKTETKENFNTKKSKTKQGVNPDETSKSDDGKSNEDKKSDNNKSNGPTSDDVKSEENQKPSGNISIQDSNETAKDDEFSESSSKQFGSQFKDISLSDDFGKSEDDTNDSTVIAPNNTKNKDKSKNENKENTKPKDKNKANTKSKEEKKEVTESKHENKVNVESEDKNKGEVKTKDQNKGVTESKKKQSNEEKKPKLENNGKKQ